MHTIVLMVFSIPSSVRVTTSCMFSIPHRTDEDFPDCPILYYWGYFKVLKKSYITLFDIICTRECIYGNYLTWKIPNFLSLPINVGSEIRSKQFVYGGSRYTLYIWPRGHKGSGSEGWFGICLYKYAGPCTGDSVQFSIVSSSTGTVKSCTVQCSENKLFRQERFMEWSDFHTLRHKIAPDGCLTLICRLFIENQVTSYGESYGGSEICMPPVYEPPPEYQCPDYRSHNPLSLKTSFNSPEANAAPFVTSDVNLPTTMNSSYNATLLENSAEFTRESIKADEPDLKIHYGEAQNSSEKALRISVRGLNTVYVKNKPEAKATPISITSNSTTSSPNSSNSPPDISSFEVVPSADELGNAENSSEIMPKNPSATTGLEILSQHLKNLYFENKYYDMTIIMEDKEFKVLKAILMARSPGFAELFSKDTGGNTTNTITIEPFDACDFTTFQDFLLYIYSGKIENMSEKNLYGLYCAACKFKIAELKQECVQFLQKSLSVDTITAIFRSANSTGSELVDMAVDFFAKNMEVIMNTDGWKQFMREEPDCAIEYHLKALKIGYTKKME